MVIRHRTKLECRLNYRSIALVSCSQTNWFLVYFGIGAYEENPTLNVELSKRFMGIPLACPSLRVRPLACHCRIAQSINSQNPT